MDEEKNVELLELGHAAMREVVQQLGTARRPDARALLQAIAISSITALRLNFGDAYASEFLRQAIAAIETESLAQLHATHSH